jgi:hypothetical protein
VGKTSVLEACALGVLAQTRVDFSDAHRDTGALEPKAPFATLLRAGSDHSSIVTALKAHGHCESKTTTVFHNRIDASPQWNDHVAPYRYRARVEGALSAVSTMLPRMLGLETEPLVATPVLLFHAFRRVRSGTVALNTLMQSGAGSTVSTFKQVVIKQLMTRSGLFEGGDASEAEKVFAQLDGLVQTYGNGRLGRLATGPDGALDLRIEPLKGGPSLSFDGLSSGQKEVITTFFLIWYATRDCPSVVLVDEPELHLNAEWQRPWVRTLTELAPWNQYILATHSEEIFASVAPERRLILRAE